MTVVPPFTTAVPCAGGDTPVTVNRSLSGSVSFASTLTVTAVFCGVEAESSLATGAWFTWLTVIDTVAADVESTWPSCALNWNESRPE